MWESPIIKQLPEVKYDFDDEVMKIVASYDIDVNKEELLKALQYDRNQYEKGYADGYARAIDKFVRKIIRRLEEKIAKRISFVGMSDKECGLYAEGIEIANEIAEQIKNDAEKQESVNQDDPYNSEEFCRILVETFSGAICEGFYNKGDECYWILGLEWYKTLRFGELSSEMFSYDKHGNILICGIPVRYDHKQLRRVDLVKPERG